MDGDGNVNYEEFVGMIYNIVSHQMPFPLSCLIGIRPKPRNHWLPQTEMFLFRILGHHLLRRTRRLWRVKIRKKNWELITTTLSTPSLEIKIQQLYYQAKVDTKAPLMRETIFTLGNYFILSFYNGTLCCYNSCQYTQDTPNQTCFGVQE